MNHPKKWDRCLYCDASIAGDDAHVAMLHDPYCPHGKSLRKLEAATKERDAFAAIVKRFVSFASRWGTRSSWTRGSLPSSDQGRTS